MKNYLLFTSLLLWGFSASSQHVLVHSSKSVCTDPAVTITLSMVGTDSFTAYLEPNAECARYEYVAMTDDEITLWTGMMGLTLEQLISMWGISATTAESHTWTDMTPNTTYKVLVLPYDANNNSFPYSYEEVHTNATGGQGVATIQVTVSEITETSARVIFTPDANTACYYDGLVTAELLSQVGLDSVCAILRANMPTPMYGEDDWTWTLEPATSYYAVAFGQNALDEWGDTTTYLFSTLSDVSVADYVVNPYKVFPMPCQGNFTVQGDHLFNGKALIYNVKGQLLQSIPLYADCSVLTTTLPAGSYLLQLMDAKGNPVHNQPLIIR